jgi:hypothetical protein
MKLAGIQIVRNAIKYDYCFEESINSMLEVCDAVIVAYVESEDDTFERLIKMSSDRLFIIQLKEADWNLYPDKHRLSYITNIAIQHADRLGFPYILSCQADEVVHESSYPAIRRFIEKGGEAAIIRRVNLWKTPDFELNVPHERQPCNTQVLRLARSNFRAYDDAESLGLNTSHEVEFCDDIVLVHYGFVRKKEVMKSKIINMQQGVFGMIDYDKKLDECEVFNPDLWFDPTKDLKPISVTHPKIALDWVKNRL